MSFSRADLDVGYIVSSYFFERGVRPNFKEYPPEYEIIAFENQLGEEFVRLRRMGFWSDEADLLMRVFDVTRDACDVTRTVRSPSFFRVGSEYRIVILDVYFKVVAKTAEGVKVTGIGGGNAPTVTWSWAAICERACEELAPHPEPQN